MTTKRRISFWASPATRQKVGELAEIHGTQAEVWAVAVDRLHSDTFKERTMEFAQYVHKYDSIAGYARYAVGEWNQEQAQYTAPHDATTARATGCSASFSQAPGGLPDTYDNFPQALRRARYLFYEMDKEYHDLMAEGEE